MKLKWLHQPPRWLHAPLGPTGIVLVLTLPPVVSALDYMTGTQFNFVLFHLIPTSLLAWRSRLRWAIVAAVSSGAGRVVADSVSLRGTPEARWLPFWNGFAVGTLMLGTAWVLSRLHVALRAERELARVDSLTGVANGRSFYERVGHEVARSRRSGAPLTLVYIDLDDFKLVNDELGHAEGDRLLREVGTSISMAIRETDAVARLGGDEFGILLPETGQEGAEAVLTKVQTLVSQLANENGWPIGQSLGAATFLAPPDSIDELVRCADELMYEAKNAGKNQVVYRVCE